MDVIAEKPGAALRQGLDLLRPTLYLFTIDTVANAVDYAFHIFLGRSLPPGDFAVFQAVNAALLIAVTAFGVMQPVLARFVAAGESGRAAGGRASPETTALFRTYFGWSAAAGLLLGTLALLLEEGFAELLNIPVYAVRYGAIVLLLILLRPVVAGTLQGAQRFIPYGMTRLAFAVGRFAFAALVLGFGAGLAGAVASLPFGQLAAVTSGLLFLGVGVLRGGGSGKPAARVREGIGLAGWAFVAYAAFTAMQNLDLLWVNRVFAPDEAGAYAAAVLLRRILILFPAAAAVVMYPRVVAAVAGKELPDRQVAWTQLFVFGSVAALALVYAAAGPRIVGLAFGPGYETAGPLMGWMAAGTLGFAVSSVWLNLFLATRPRTFILFLAAAAALQAAGLALFHGDLLEVVAVFGAGGWLAAVGGGLVYVIRLRPRLKASFV